MGFKRRASRRTGRAKTSSMGWVLLIGAVLAGVYWASDTWRHAGRARVCHEQQQKMQRCIDSLGDANLDQDFETVLARLVAENCLRGRLGPDASSQRLEDIEVSDPGQGAGSYRNYVVMAGSLKVGCRRHGSPFLAANQRY